MKNKSFLKEQLEKIKPSLEELKEIVAQTKCLINLINKNIKKRKVSAEVFVGGSSAKDTLIRKRKYDIDIFVRFDRKYDEKKISDMLKSLLPARASKIHGSRDYFSLKQNGKTAEFEIVPVLKISKPEQALNITDLSYFHVKYIKNKIKKNKKLADEIRLAKAFAYYQGCYGAESYINGFSGYALELLVSYYGSFEKFIKSMIKTPVGEVIDPAKHYKNTSEALQELNKSKIQGAFVLIDPTFMDRNALAALSKETFKNFQKSCKDFLRKPSKSFFELKDKKEILEKKYKKNLIKLNFTSTKQAGDIAGTKLKKFYGYFMQETNKFFEIKKSDFDYNESNNLGTIFIVAVPKKKIVFTGPPVNMKEALEAFKMSHKKVFFRKGKAYSEKNFNMSFEKFLGIFLESKKKVISDMGIRFKNRNRD